MLHGVQNLQTNEREKHDLLKIKAVINIMQVAIGEAQSLCGLYCYNGDTLIGQSQYTVFNKFFS